MTKIIRLYYDNVYCDNVSSLLYTINGLSKDKFQNLIDNYKSHDIFSKACSYGYLINGYIFESVLSMLDLPYEHLSINNFIDDNYSNNFYVINLFLDKQSFYVENNFFDGISEKVKELIREKRLKLLIWHGSEVCPIGSLERLHYEFFFKALDNRVKEEGFCFDNVFFVSNNILHDEFQLNLGNINSEILNFKYLGFNYFLLNFIHFHNYKNYSFNIDKKYNFICLNHMLRLHRLILAYFIIVNRLYDNNQFSINFLSEGKNKEIYYELIIDNYLTRNLEKKEIFNEEDKIKFLENKDKFTVDEDFKGDDNKTMFIYENNSFINIVTETSFSDISDINVFITEKTWKAIYYYQPFIILGDKGIINTLRNMGFDVFDDLLNHDYDTMDGFERIDMFYAELKRIAEMDTLYLQNFIYKNKHRLINNKKLLYKQKVIIKDKIIFNLSLEF